MNQQLARILQQIAYPRRGTTEESLSLQDFANMIQRITTAEQLEAIAEDRCADACGPGL